MAALPGWEPKQLDKSYSGEVIPIFFHGDQKMLLGLAKGNRKVFVGTDLRSSAITDEDYGKTLVETVVKEATKWPGYIKVTESGPFRTEGKRQGTYIVYWVNGKRPFYLFEAVFPRPSRLKGQTVFVGHVPDKGDLRELKTMARFIVLSKADPKPPGYKEEACATPKLSK